MTNENHAHSNTYEILVSNYCILRFAVPVSLCVYTLLSSHLSFLTTTEMCQQHCTLFVAVGKFEMNTEEKKLSKEHCLIIYFLLSVCVFAGENVLKANGFQNVRRVHLMKCHIL